MKALVVVDVQNDFCKGGALAVIDADNIVSVVNKTIQFLMIIIFLLLEQKIGIPLIIKVLPLILMGKLENLVF